MFKKFVCAGIVGMFVSGSVFASDPVSGLPVSVVKGDKVYSAETGEDGRFEIDKLPSGKYTVSFVIAPEILSIELKGNGTNNLSLHNPVVPETGGVHTYISVKRNGKKLTGKVTEDVLPEPSPVPSPTATPE